MLKFMPQQDENSALYSVYIYHKSKLETHSLKWEKVSATRNMKRAIKHAKLLRQKHEYEKIEIKKQFFCKQEQKLIGKTFKIYKDRNRSWSGLIKD